MKLTGKLFKDGKFWLIEVPILDVMTQGHTRKEAFEMIADAIETLVDKENFKIIKLSPFLSFLKDICCLDTFLLYQCFYK
jgi:predicted RNase H-like HicB family nuclease